MTHYQNMNLRTLRLASFLGLQRSGVGVLAMVVFVGMVEPMSGLRVSSPFKLK